MLKIYDTYRKDKFEFKPIHDNKINMYVCGLTPYDNAHLGHARTYIAFDIIKRYLLVKGYDVFHMQNITDIEDKIIKRAKERKKNPIKLAEHFHKKALDVFRKLNIIDADIYPKVSEHIKDIIDMIKKIIENGYAYESETGVYFDVRKFKNYGKLSGQRLEELRKGVRKEVEPGKRNPEDFALWKKTNEIPCFDSPWGKGRPGWHIECSAMSLKYIEGNTLDIHGGARDLIFPHHENEIAQSEAATGERFVNFWMHTGFLTINGEKMSKSLGNFITIEDALKKHSPNALRMFFAMVNYRSPIDYNDKNIKQAQETVNGIRNFVLKLKASLKERKHQEKNESLRKEVKNKISNFYKFMDDNFNLPVAITYFFSIMKSINQHLNEKSRDYQLLEYVLEETERIIYIIGLKFEEKKKSNLEEKLIDLLIKIRNDARKNKNYELSDKIRDELKKIGIELEDKGEKTTYIYKN